MELYSLPYVLLCFFFLIIFFVEYANKKKDKSRKSIRIISACSFILFFGFRGYIGSDWFNYNFWYDTTSWSEWLITDYEVGFSAIAKTVKLFGASYWMFQLVITLIQVYLLDRFLSKHSPYISLAYLILIALFPIVIIDLLRNFTAILIVLNGLDLLLQNKNKKFALVILLSITFHTSSIIYFTFFFMKKRLIKRGILAILLITGLVVYFLQLNFYENLLFAISNIVDGRVAYLILSSVSEDEVAYGVSIGIIEKIGLFVLIMCNHRNLRAIPLIIVNTCYIYILIYLFFSTSQTFINRFANLFMWGYILMYIAIIYELRFKPWAKSFLVFLLLFCFIRTYVSYNNILYRYSNTLLGDDDMYERSYNRDYFYSNR